MTLREATHRTDMAGLQLVVDQVVDASGNALASSLTPQSAVAANAGVAATDAATAATIFSATATSGSFPTADGAWTVANAATPTVAELQEGIIEARANLITVLAENAVFKTAIDALIVENATFKTSINAIITALTTAGVFV